MPTRLSNVGFHADIANVDQFLGHFSAFQFMLPNDKPWESFVLDRYVHGKLRAVQESGAEIVFHGPFWQVLTRPHKMNKLSLRAIHEHFDCLRLVGGRSLVIHPGGLGNLKNPEDSVTAVQSVDFLYKLMVNLAPRIPEGMTLYLENTPGSKGGTKGLLTAEISQVVSMLTASGVKNIKLCYDTEHSYAAGESRELVAGYLEQAGLIHLNSVPSEVMFGSHLDRHSDCPLSQSFGIRPDWLVNVVRCYPQKIKIIECNPFIALDNHQFLVERLEESVVLSDVATT